MNRNRLHVLLAGFLALVLSGASVAAEAGTVYAIIVGDTEDTSIGASVKADIRMADAFTRKLAAAYGTRRQIILTGADFDSRKLIRAIDSLNVSPSDFVVLYISAHGNEGAMGSDWPLISFKKGPSVEAADLVTSLSGKSHRFLAVFDACNGSKILDPLDRVPAVAEYIPAQVDRLFKNIRGGVVVTSSERPYVSYADERGNGSVFSRQFFRAMDSTLGSTENQYNWRQMLTQVRDATTREGQVPKFDFITRDQTPR